MSSIAKDQIWTSELNNLESVQGGFDRSKTVRFYDTTLRDGEQSVGVCFTPDEKFEIACKLAEMGVSRIESGFPRVSPEDTQAVERILAAELDSEIWGCAYRTGYRIRADRDIHQRCQDGSLRVHPREGAGAGRQFGQARQGKRY
jgi:hypothetical protein